jgi:hypothetical protein
MIKAGDTFFTSAASCSVQVCRAPSRPRKCRKEISTPPTTAIDDRSAPSYDRTATLGRIAQNLSLWRGSAALKPQILEPHGSLIFTRDEMLNGCPLLALSGRSLSTTQCPLSGVKRTSRSERVMSAFVQRQEPRTKSRRALRPFLVLRTEHEPYHEAHHHNRCNQNDQKGSGVESHSAAFFAARTMCPFQLFT